MSIQQTISDLLGFFPAAQFSEPADTTHIEEIFEQFPNAPVQLRAFWSICDGINLCLDDELDGIVYSISKLRKTLIWWLDDPTGLHSLLLPIADDGCGDYVCIHCGDSALGGCVLFVDQHWTPAYLLAGSLSTYLEFWAEKCKAENFQNGKKDSRFVPPRLSEWPWLGVPEFQHPWPFDEVWLRTNDVDADRILGDDSLRSFFENQDNLR